MFTFQLFTCFALLLHQIDRSRHRVPIPITIYIDERAAKKAISIKIINDDKIQTLKKYKKHSFFSLSWRVQFNRVEGKIFYGHKIVLVTASPRFQSMLSSKLSEGNTPTVQINDIRYHIFQVSVACIIHHHIIRTLIKLEFVLMQFYGLNFLFLVGHAIFV